MKSLKWLLRAALAAAVLAAAGAAWLLGTEAGLRWALRFAPAELEIEGARGALVRAISAERVAWQGSEARQIEFQLNLLSLLADTISVEFLHVETLLLKRPPSSEQQNSTALPFKVRVSDVQIKSVVFEGYEINELRADYSGTAERHEAQASFTAAGARARIKATYEKELALSGDVLGLNLAVIDPSLPQTGFRVRADIRGTPASLTGKLALTNPEPGPWDKERLPFSRLDASLATNLKSVELQTFKAELHPRGTVQGKGRASAERAQFDIRVADLDLRGLYSTLRSTHLSGPLELDLAATRQRAKGTLAQDDMSLTADAEREGDEVVVRALHARAGDSEARGHGRLRLDEPISFDASLKLTRFDPSRFGDYPEGSLNGAVHAVGDLGGSGFARWDFSGSRLLKQPLESKGTARLQGRRVTQADAWARLGANRATVKGSFGEPKDRMAWTLHVPDLGTLVEGLGGEIRASGDARGSWKAPRATIDAQASKLQLAKAFVLERAAARVSGTLEQHEGELKGANRDLDFTAALRGGWGANAWRGQILSLKNEGAYPLELKSVATLEAGARRVVLGHFDAEAAGGRAAVESVRWEAGRLTSRGSIAALPAKWILDALGADRVSGDLRIDGDWALASTPRLNGRLVVRRSDGDLVMGETPLELSYAVLDAKLTEDRVAATAEVAARLASLRVTGTTAGLRRDSAIDFTGELQAAELRQLTEALTTQARLSGRLSATLRATGTVGKPRLSGALRGDALGFEMPQWGIALREGRLRAELDANQLRITEARLSAGDGFFSASGTMPLAFADGAAALEWSAERFAVLNRPDMRLVVSGKGITSFDGKKLGLIGKLRADHGRFEYASALPQLDDDVVVVGRDDPAVARKRVPLPIDLDLTVDLGSRLTMRGYGYDGGIGGQLHFSTSPAGELLARGQLRALKGRFRAYGKELEVDPGVVTFDGPLDAPGLDITAWRRHQAVEAGVRVTGTLQAPHVELVSNPPVSENERLSWLVLGRAPTNTGAADLAVLQAASGAAFGRGDGVPVQRRFAQRFGLDEVNVRGSSDLAGNVVALGKRYSDKVYFSFERSISTTTEYLVKLDYTLTQRVSLRGQTGTTSGVGLFYRYSWD
jgi:translocation and assembly module TamB